MPSQSMDGTITPTGELTEIRIIADNPQGFIFPSGALAYEVLTTPQLFQGTITPVGELTSAVLDTQCFPTDYSCVESSATDMDCVGACETSVVVPPTTECPECLDCPECPECPECPDCPDCPDCPECPPVTDCCLLCGTGEPEGLVTGDIACNYQQTDAGYANNGQMWLKGDWKPVTENVSDALAGTGTPDTNVALESLGSWAKHTSYALVASARRYSTSNTTPIEWGSSTRNSIGAVGEMLYLQGTVPSSADYDLKLDVQQDFDGSSSSFGVAARYSTGADSGYILKYNPHSGGTWELVARTAGVDVSLLTGQIPARAQIWLQLRGSTLNVFMNGILRDTVVDTTFSAAGRVGLWFDQELGAHCSQWRLLYASGADDLYGWRRQGLSGQGGTDTVQIGLRAYAVNPRGIAIGSDVESGGFSGFNGTAEEDLGAVSIGNFINNYGGLTIAIGQNINVYHDPSIVIGNGLASYALGGLLIGGDSTLNPRAVNSIGLGTDVGIFGPNSVGIGSAVELEGDNDIGIGTVIAVTHDYSVVISAYSGSSTAANQLMFGGSVDTKHLKEVRFNNANASRGCPNFVFANAVLSTGATEGFPYIPSCAGAKTGTPHAYTGGVPLIYDTTNNKLYAYNPIAAAWKSVTLS